MVENKYAGGWNFTFDKSLQGGAEENEREQGFSQGGFDFESTGEGGLGESILGGQESAKTGKQSDLFELNYGSVLTPNPASDGEIFYPDLFYRDHIKVNMTPAVPSLQLRDSAAHRRAADVLNRQYFPGIFAKPEEISKDYGFPMPKQSVERSPRSRKEKTENRVQAELGVMDGNDSAATDVKYGSGYTAAVTDLPEGIPESTSDTVRQQTTLSGENKNEGKSLDDRDSGVYLEIPDFKESDKTRKIYFNSSQKEQYQFHQQMENLNQKIENKESLTSQDIKNYEQLKAYTRSYNVNNSISFNQVHNETKYLANVLKLLIENKKYQERLLSLNTNNDDDNKLYQNLITLEVANIAEIKEYTKNNHVHMSDLKKLAGTWFPEVTASMDLDDAINSKILFDKCLVIRINAESDPNSINFKRFIGINNVFEPIYDDLEKRYSNENSDSLVCNNQSINIELIVISHMVEDSAWRLRYPYHYELKREICDKFANSDDYPELAEKVRLIGRLPLEERKKALINMVRSEINNFVDNMQDDVRGAECKQSFDNKITEEASKQVEPRSNKIKKLDPEQTIAGMLESLKNYGQPVFSSVDADGVSTYSESEATIHKFKKMLSNNSVMSEDEIEKDLTSNFYLYKDPKLDTDKHEVLIRLQEQYPEEFEIIYKYYNDRNNEVFALGISYLIALNKVRESNNFEISVVKFRVIPKEEKRILDLIIAGDSDTINQFRQDFDKGKSYEENLRILQRNAREKLPKVEFEMRAAENAIEHIRKDNLIQYINTGFFIAGFKMLDMLGSEDAQRIVAELNLGSENAIKTMDSGTARFVARFLKDNAVDIVLLAAACATGGTALAPAISRLSTTLGVAGNIQQIQDKYRQLKREGATDDELVFGVIGEIARMQVKEYGFSKGSDRVKPMLKKGLGEKGGEAVTEIGISALNSGFNQYMNKQETDKSDVEYDEDFIDFIREKVLRQSKKNVTSKLEEADIREFKRAIKESKSK